MLLFLYLGSFFNFVVASLIGVAVFLKSKKNILNQTCAFFSMAVALWSIAYFFPLTGHSEFLSLWSFRLLHIGANYISVSKLHFYFALLGKHKENKKILIVLYSVLTFFALLMPTDIFIPEVVPKFDFPYWAKIDHVYATWLTIWMGIEVYAVTYLFWNALRSKGVKRQILKYLLIGNLIFIPGGLSNFFIFFDINVIPYFSFLVSFMPLSIAYIILRYRTFSLSYNIIAYGKPMFAGASSLFLSFTLVHSMEYVIHIREILYVSFFISFSSLYLGISKLASSRFLYALFRINKVENFHFFLEKITKKYAFYEHLDELKVDLYNTFVINLKVDFIKLIFPIKKNKENAGIIEHFQDMPKEKFLVKEELLLQKRSKKKSTLLREISKLGEVCLPIYRVGKPEIIGLFILGKQKYNNPYLSEQLKQLEELGRYLSLSLSVVHYNKFLQDEVKNKTKLLNLQNKELKKSYKQLQQFDKEKDEFLAIASHELRTPITIIKGYSSLFLEGDLGKISKEQAQYIEKIFSGSKELLALVNDMLDMQKLEADRMDFAAEEISTRELIKEIVNNFQNMYAEKNIELAYQVSTKVQTTKADPRRLKQILTNLLSNACKFTPEKGKVAVKVKEYKEDKKFSEFVVSDTGIGISDNLIDKIFEKFYQIDSALQRSVSGTGLGMPIVKSMVEKMNGKIWVESVLQKGTRFHFILPKF